MKEYKVIKVKWDANLETINCTVNDMAKEGWNLVCMTAVPTMHKTMTMEFIVTFCKDTDK